MESYLRICLFSDQLDNAALLVLTGDRPTPVPTRLGVPASQGVACRDRETPALADALPLSVRALLREDPFDDR